MTRQKFLALIIAELGFDKIERSKCPEAAHLLYRDHRLTQSEALDVPDHRAEKAQALENPQAETPAAPPGAQPRLPLVTAQPAQ